MTRRAARGRRRTRSACCTTGTDPGRVARAAEPGLLVQISVRARGRHARGDRDRRHVARARGRVAPGRAAQRRRRLHRAGRRSPPAPGMGAAGLRRPRVDAGRGARAGGHQAVHAPRRAAHPHRRARGAAGVGAHAAVGCGDRRLRRGDRGAADGDVPRTAWPAGRSRCTSATCSIPTVTCRRPSRRRAPT